ncbi:MAG: helix-turn-helix domain-containing protein [Arcanobacterium sp.]
MSVQPSGVAKSPREIMVDEQTLAELRELAGTYLFGPIMYETDSSEKKVSPRITQLVGVILRELSQNRAVHVGPIPEVLTSTQAADVVGLSRPTLVKRAAAGEIPSFRVGTHTRFRLTDLVEYKRKMREQQDATFQEWTRFHEEEGAVLDDR